MIDDNLKHSVLSHDTFRQIFQSSAEGIIVVDEDENILLANPVSERMFGYEAGELTGVTLGTLLPKRLREGHARHRAEFFNTPSPRRMGVGRALLALRKDNTEFPVEISLR